MGFILLELSLVGNEVVISIKKIKFFYEVSPITI